MDTPFISNRFGTVTPTRVQLTLARGGTEEIALRQITAVRDEVDRHPVIGAVAVAVGVIAVLSSLHNRVDLLGVVFGLIAIGFAALVAAPRPRVTLHLADGRTRVQRGRIGTVDEAQQFVAAVRAHLFIADPVTHR